MILRILALSDVGWGTKMPSIGRTYLKGRGGLSIVGVREARLIGQKELLRGLLEGITDAIDLARSEFSEKGKGDGAGGDVLTDRKFSAAKPELLSDIRLQVEIGREHV